MKKELFTEPSIVAIATKSKTDRVRAVIIDDETYAFWLKHALYKTYRYCSQCHHIHKKSAGPLPSICPCCNVKMITGPRGKKYHEIINALVNEGKNLIFFVNKNHNEGDTSN